MRKEKTTKVNLEFECLYLEKSLKIKQFSKTVGQCENDKKESESQLVKYIFFCPIFKVFLKSVHLSVISSKQNRSNAERGSEIMIMTFPLKELLPDEVKAIKSNCELNLKRTFILS